MHRSAAAPHLRCGPTSASLAHHQRWASEAPGSAHPLPHHQKAWTRPSTDTGSATESTLWAASSAARRSARGSVWRGARHAARSPRARGRARGRATRRAPAQPNDAGPQTALRRPSRTARIARMRTLEGRALNVAKRDVSTPTQVGSYPKRRVWRRLPPDPLSNAMVAPPRPLGCRSRRAWPAPGAAAAPGPPLEPGACGRRDGRRGQRGEVARCAPVPSAAAPSATRCGHGGTPAVTRRVHRSAL